MEGLIVFHGRNRFKGTGLNTEKAKKILWVKYKDKETLSIHTLILDHIVPFCISEDSSIENLQLLPQRYNGIKTGRDKRVINQFKKLGWVETQTHNIMKLFRTKKFLKEEYLKRFQEVSKTFVKQIEK